MVRRVMGKEFILSLLHHKTFSIFLLSIYFLYVTQKAVQLLFNSIYRLNQNIDQYVKGILELKSLLNSKQMI